MSSIFINEWFGKSPFKQIGGEIKNAELTYDKDADFINSIADWNTHSKSNVSPEYNNMIKKRLESGNYSYNPSTGSLTKLDKPVSKENLPESQYTTPRVDEKSVKNLTNKPETPQTWQSLYDSTTPWEEWPEEARTSYLQHGHERIVNNPVFNTLAALTPVGAVAAGMKGAVRLPGDIYKGDVKAVGKDLLSMAPFGVYKIGGKLAANAPKTSQAVYKGTKYGNKGAKGLEGGLQSLSAKTQGLGTIDIKR